VLRTRKTVVLSREAEGDEMGAGAATFIWAAILLHLAFGPIVVGAYALIARPNVDRNGSSGWRGWEP